MSDLGILAVSKNRWFGFEEEEVFRFSSLIRDHAGGCSSCDLRANERPRKKLHEKGTSDRQTDIYINWYRNSMKIFQLLVCHKLKPCHIIKLSLNQPLGRFSLCVCLHWLSMDRPMVRLTGGPLEHLPNWRSKIRSHSWSIGPSSKWTVILTILVISANPVILLNLVISVDLMIPLDIGI